MTATPGGSPSSTAPERLDSFLDAATLPYAFCPGCGHTSVVDRIDEALVRLGLDPSRVVIVSDIGCAGIADRYFRTHAFHGLHGRSVTYASGIKMANPELEVVVLIGDGGCGIGGHHLINAARRNVDITVIVFNNLNFGMTGGQYSVTTPPASVTATSPAGLAEHPMDIAGTVAVNGASFAARSTAHDPHLVETIARAIAVEGFALVDIWELCVAYYVPRNAFSRSALQQKMEDLGLAPGVVADVARPPFHRAHAETAAALGPPRLAARPWPTTHVSGLQAPRRVVLAGSAGQHVRSAGTLLAAGAVLSGAWATRRDDYPVTVRTGYSLSEVILSPHPIRFTGVDVPDVAVVLADEGAARIRSRLAAMAADGVVLLADGVRPPETPAVVRPIAVPPAARPHVRNGLSTLAVASVVRELGLYEPAALAEAARRTQRPDVAAKTVAALAAMEME